MLATSVLGLTWLGLDTASPVPIPSVPSEAASARVADPAVSPSDEADYAALVDRPLFQPSRRPGQAPPDVVPDVVAAPPLPAPSGSLVGVVIGPQRTVAIVRTDGRSAILAEGDTIAGWQVRRVMRDQVQLERDGQVAEWYFVQRHDGEPAQAQPASTRAAIRRR